MSSYIKLNLPCIETKGGGEASKKKAQLLYEPRRESEAVRGVARVGTFGSVSMTRATRRTKTLRQSITHSRSAGLWTFLKLIRVMKKKDLWRIEWMQRVLNLT